MPSSPKLSAQGSSSNPRVSYRVWDRPLRGFHWALVLAIGGAIGTGIAGGDWMPWHGRAGQAVLGLLAFRCTWGWIGGQHARFSDFWPTPSRLRRYWRGEWSGMGHNPLGALSVFTLFGLLTTQAVLGLLSNDDIAFSGPWSAAIDADLALRLTGWHQRLAPLLYAWIGLHLLALVFHVQVKRHALVRPMFTGQTLVDAGHPMAQPAAPWAWVWALGVAFGVVWATMGPFWV